MSATSATLVILVMVFVQVLVSQQLLKQKDEYLAWVFRDPPQAILQIKRFLELNLRWVLFIGCLNVCCCYDSVTFSIFSFDLELLELIEAVQIIPALHKIE